MPTTTAARTGRTQPCPDPPRPAHARPPRAFLDLGALLASPRCARSWTCEILREWHLTGLADTAETIVGELVANAVHASSGLPEPIIRLALAFDNGELAILVVDHNPDLPQPQQPAEDALSGRGLLIVEALSDRHGWYALEGGTAGKVVWAVLEAAPVAPSDLAARFMPLAPAWSERARHLASGNHRALGLDPTAIRLDTPRVDIAAELGNRAKPAARPPAARQPGCDPSGRRRAVHVAAARATLTARHGHMVLKFTPASCPPAGSTKRHGPAGQSAPALSTSC